MHKKVIDTAQKGLRRSIPDNMPYFFIEWSRGGMAHIIEDAEQFPHDFGADIVAGMMGVDPVRVKKQGGAKGSEKGRVGELKALLR